MGKDHRDGGARRHRRDRPGGDGDHLRDLRGVRAGRVHEAASSASSSSRSASRSRWRCWCRCSSASRSTRCSRASGSDPPTNRLLKLPVHRPPDARHRPAARRAARRLRAADPLDLLGPPLPRARAAAAGLRPAVRRRRPARPRAPRALALRHDHAARAGRCSPASRSFVGAIALAPLVGTEFIPETDQSYIQLNVALPVGTSLERGATRCARSRRSSRTLPRGPDGLDHRRRHRQRPRATRRELEHPADQAAASASARRSRSRTRSARRSQPIPGIERLARQPADLRRAARPRPEGARDRGAASSPTRSRKIPGIADLETSVKPGLPAYAVRLKPDAVRELGLTTTQLAASLRAYVNGDVATYWTSPDGEQVDVELRLPQAQRENVDAARRPAGRLREGRHADRAGARRRRSCRWSTPSRHQAPGPAAPPGDLRRRRRAGRAATSAPTCRSSSRRRSCRPATASTSAARRKRAGRRPSTACWCALGAAVIFIYIVLAVAVRQLPAAARDHGLAAAGADRRDAGAAASRARRSTCSR